MCVEDALVGHLVFGEPAGQRLQRVAVGAPVFFFVGRAVIGAVDVADVVAQVAIGVAEQKGRPLAAPGARHQPPRGRRARRAHPARPLRPSRCQRRRRGPACCRRWFRCDGCIRCTGCSRRRRSPAASTAGPCSSTRTARPGPARPRQRSRPPRARCPAACWRRPRRWRCRRCRPRWHCAQVAGVLVGDVHRAALAAAVARFLAQQFANIRSTAAPLARQWPWPRWVLVM